MSQMLNRSDKNSIDNVWSTFVAFVYKFFVELSISFTAFIVNLSMKLIYPNSKLTI